MNFWNLSMNKMNELLESPLNLTVKQNLNSFKITNLKKYINGVTNGKEMPK